MGASTIIVYAIRGLVVVLFLLLGARELGTLFTKHDRRMGAGVWRVWAVARAAMQEAWAGRIWLLPVLWAGAALVLIMAVRPFDESERIPLYIKTLLSVQEVLLLVMIWVMACVSLPRERERKILVTNASKPLSRLEIVLGKIAGFTVVSAGVLGVMWAASLAILYVSDGRVKQRAAEGYELQRRDFNKTLVAPSEALKQLSEEGSLFAYNYITVPKGNMNVGMLGPSREAGQPMVRYMIGGTYEKAVYQFAPRLEVPEFLTLMPPGRRPFFVFNFPLQDRRGAALAPPVQIRVTAFGTGPVTPQEKIVTLNAQGEGYWEPDRPEELFTTFGAPPEGDNGANVILKERGMVTVEVTCVTPGVLLQVLEGADPDAAGVVPKGTEANVEFSNRVYEYDAAQPVAMNVPRAHPVVRGFERRERQSVDGPSEKQPIQERAIYRFAGSSLRDVPADAAGNFKLSLELETYKGDKPEDPTYAGVLVRTMDGAADYKNARIEVHEKRVMTIDVPAATLGNKDPTKRGDMFVVVGCETAGQSVTLVEDSVRIELPATPFAVNLFKSEAVILLEAVLLIALSVMCSVRVGWAVAMLTSGVAYLFGYLVDFIGSLPDYGGLGALNYHAFGQNQAWFNFFDAAAGMLWKVLGFISILVPNFTLYKPQEFIGNLQNMPWSVVAADAGMTATYGLPFVALAYLMFRKQELG